MRIFDDFNNERNLLLPYNISIHRSLDIVRIPDINYAIINPIDDPFYTRDLDPLTVALSNDFAKRMSVDNNTFLRDLQPIEMTTFNTNQIY